MLAHSQTYFYAAYSLSYQALPLHLGDIPPPPVIFIIISHRILYFPEYKSITSCSQNQSTNQPRLTHWPAKSSESSHLLCAYF